jgi:hypothetical protein
MIMRSSRLLLLSIGGMVGVQVASTAWALDLCAKSTGGPLRLRDACKTIEVRLGGLNTTNLDLDVGDIDTLGNLILGSDQSRRYRLAITGTSTGTSCVAACNTAFGNAQCIAAFWDQADGAAAACSDTFPNRDCVCLDRQ